MPKWVMLNLPTTLTVARIATIPLFIAAFYWHHPLGHLLAAFIFAAAAATDWLDGYLARSWSQSTSLGAFLDPVADKLLVATALVLIVSHLHSIWTAFPATIIIGREIAVSALREWMAILGRRVKVRVAKIAKVKTGTQMIALTILIAYQPSYPLNLLHLGTALLTVSAVLTLWSMAHYLKAAWPDLTLAQEKQ